MQLFTYYSLDECNNRDYIIKMLDQLKDDGKIDYNYVESDLIKIEDIDLSDKEIETLIDDFDNYDVIADLDRSLLDDNFDDFPEDEEEF
jgi:hypothetical protein